MLAIGRALVHPQLLLQMSLLWSLLDYRKEIFQIIQEINRSTILLVGRMLMH